MISTRSLSQSCDLEETGKEMRDLHLQSVERMALTHRSGIFNNGCRGCRSLKKDEDEVEI